MPSLEWVDVEINPCDQASVWSDDWDGAPVLEKAVSDQLTILMRNRLNRVINEPDEHRCEANGCADMRDTASAKPVGWVLVEDDPPARSGCYWWWLTLVQVDGHVSLACEDCTPTNIYPERPASVRT